MKRLRYLSSVVVADDQTEMMDNEMMSK